MSIVLTDPTVGTGRAYFQAGGSLSTEQPTYVERQADRELFEHLLEGRFCYVLTARQMGKSSLRVRTMARLEAQGVRCCAVDITTIGQDQTTAESWYYSLATRIAAGLGLKSGFRAWWDEQRLLTPVARLSAFLEEFILAQTASPIVVMIDEVDSMLSLDRKEFSTDDFFAAIRSCYNARADKAVFTRLTFALFGVAAPEDLMSDTARTPFNIGRAIELGYFDEASADPLLKGLAGSERGAMLQRVFRWTGGQPYLTQRVCQELELLAVKDSHQVDAIVARLFLTGATDPNITAIESRIAANQNESARMLEVFWEIATVGSTPANERDKAQMYLKLTGLVAENASGKLVIANLIYSEVFSPHWIHQTRLRLVRPFAADVERWIEKGRARAALLRGSLLREALAWSLHRHDLTHTEREFLETSRENEQEERMQRGLAAAARKLRWVVAGLVVALLVAVIAIVLERRTAHTARLTNQDVETLKQGNERLKLAADSLNGTIGEYNSRLARQADADSANRRVLVVQRESLTIQTRRIDELVFNAESLAKDTVRLAQSLGRMRNDSLTAQKRLTGVLDSIADARRSITQARSSLLAFVQAISGTQYNADDVVRSLLEDTRTRMDIRALGYNALAQGSFINDSAMGPIVLRDLDNASARVRLTLLNSIARGYWYHERLQAAPYRSRIEGMLRDRAEPLSVRSYAALALKSGWASADRLSYQVLRSALASGDSAYAVAIILASSPAAQGAQAPRYPKTYVTLPADTINTYARMLDRWLVELVLEERDRDEIRSGSEEYWLSLLAVKQLQSTGTSATVGRLQMALGQAPGSPLRDRVIALIQELQSRAPRGN